MTKIPMTVSLPKDIYNAIDRLAALQGSSKSALIVSYLEPSLPIIENMADLIERLQNSSPEERLKLMGQLVDIEQTTHDQMTKLTDFSKGVSNE